MLNYASFSVLHSLTRIAIDQHCYTGSNQEPLRHVEFKLVTSRWESIKTENEILLVYCKCFPHQDTIILIINGIDITTDCPIVFEKKVHPLNNSY